MIKIILIISSLFVNLSVHSTSDYLKINDSWGYHKVKNDSDGCSIYEARNIHGSIVIRAPIYRIAGFIFTVEKNTDTCFKN